MQTRPPPANRTEPHIAGSGIGQPEPARRVHSSELLAGQREIEIDHQGQLYRLRLTAQGKLILTK